jgi:hypothetical protein
LAVIKEADWYQSWAQKTDTLKLELLHIDDPPQTQTGYMVAKVQGVTDQLARLAKVIGLEQETTLELHSNAKRLWRQYDAARRVAKNDWMSSGKHAWQQLRIMVDIMDGSVFADPENLKFAKVRPFLPWMLLMQMYAPPDLRAKAEYWLKQPDATNRDFADDLVPLIRRYSRQIFTELKFLAGSRLAHRHLVETYKVRCENYDWKQIAEMVNRLLTTV